MSEAALLEVIVDSAQDARAAEGGGADRLEVVSAMGQGGLTPEAAIVSDVAESVSIPVRAMLRSDPGFRAEAGEIEELLDAAAELISAGAGGFVLGFVDFEDSIDVEATVRLAKGLEGKPWTFHRAIDHTRDTHRALAELAPLAQVGCDTVLAAGSPEGVGDGLATLTDLAGASSHGGGPGLMAGGGLRHEHVRPLAAAGVRRFHIGTGARRVANPAVDPERVARWREAIDLATS